MAANSTGMYHGIDPTGRSSTNFEPCEDEFIEPAAQEDPSPAPCQGPASAPCQDPAPVPYREPEPIAELKLKKEALKSPEKVSPRCHKPQEGGLEEGAPRRHTPAKGPTGSVAEAGTQDGGAKVPPGFFSSRASCFLTASEGASVCGPFGLLPLEIQEGILLSLPATELAPVELSSSYFRALVLDGEMWRRKAEMVGREALAVMNKEIDKMAEKVEEKKCLLSTHASIVRMEMKRIKEEAWKKAVEDESDSDDEESKMESDVEVMSETERNCQQSKNDAVTNKNCDSDNMENKVMKEEGGSENKEEANDDNRDSAANNEDFKVNDEDSQEIKSIDKMEEKDSQPEKEDLTRYFTYISFSNRQDPEGREVDRWLRMCNVCFGSYREYYRKNNFYFNIENWQGSIQTEIDKEVVRKEQLEELLADPVGSGKEKMRGVLEFLRDTPPLPSKYFDMAMEEGMPGKDL